MWAEVSPDGRLVWTSSGRDLLAYRTAAITRAAAARPPLRAVARLAGVVPASRGSPGLPSTATAC